VTYLHTPRFKTTEDNALQTAAIGPKENAEFGLDLIRLLSRRLKEIDQQVVTIGTALAQGRLLPSSALKLADRIAPGCIDVIYLSMFEGVSPEQLRDDLASNEIEAGVRK
jgi:hypothetical protein